jgi:hypothetical protein
MQWRAVSHGLAEFENQGLLADGDEAWRPVLAALIDGYAAAAHPTQDQTPSGRRQRHGASGGHSLVVPAT